jgi:hypothetical protein
VPFFRSWRGFKISSNESSLKTLNIDLDTTGMFVISMCL